MTEPFEPTGPTEPTGPYEPTGPHEPTGPIPPTEPLTAPLPHQSEYPPPAFAAQPSPSAGTEGVDPEAHAGSAYGRFDALPESPESPALQPSKRRGLVVGVVVGALVLVGAAFAIGKSMSGTAVDKQAVIKTTTAPAAAGGTTVHSHGTTVVLPVGWTQLPTSPAELASTATKLAVNNPGLAKAVAAYSNSSAVSGFALLAVRSGSDPHHLESMDVVVAPAQGVTLDFAALEIKTQLANVDAVQFVQTPVQVNGRDGFKLTYTLRLKAATGTIDIPTVQYCVIDKDKLAVLTVGNYGDGVEAQAIADTFSID